MAAPNRCLPLSACPPAATATLQGTAGSLQSLCWASASTGSIASAYFSGSLVGDYGPRTVFALTAAFPLLVTGAALAIPEERVRRPGVMAAGKGKGKGGAAAARSGSPKPGGGAADGVAAAFRAQASLLWATAKQRTILLPAIFVFLWQVRAEGLGWAGVGGGLAGGGDAAAPCCRCFSGGQGRATACLR